MLHAICQVLSSIGNNNIICSGVSAGSIDTVLPYLLRMSTIIEGRDKSTFFPQCERNGVDQGVHNVLVHTNQISSLKVWGQRDSPVLNLQARMAQISGGEVRNLKGDVASVIHQYDRYPDLQQGLFEKASLSSCYVP
jgi:hypothetical protein